MAGEIIYFSDLLEVAAKFVEELKTVLGRPVKLKHLTNSKSLFDVRSKRYRTSKKRMILEMFATREGFKDKSISDIAFVRRSHNIADGLTKSMSQA